MLLVAVLLACGALVWAVAQLGREVVSIPEPSRITVSVAASGQPAPLTLTLVKPDDIGPELRLQLPIKRRVVTGIGYDRSPATNVMPLTPEGSRANVSVAERMLRRFFATMQPSSLRYVMLTSSSEPNIVHVGAPEGAQVYAPVSGSVVAIADHVVDGSVRSQAVEIQPPGDPETVVVVRGISVADTLSIGDGVAQRTTLLGAVAKPGPGVRHPLAHYTHDDGSGVTMYVRHRTPDVLPGG